MEIKKKADEVSADNKEQIQPTPVGKQNLKAVAPVKPAETTSANKSAAEDQKEHAAKVPSDKEQIQPTTVRKQNPEAAAPEEPAETTPATKTPEEDQEEDAAEAPSDNEEQIQSAAVGKQILEAAAPMKSSETTSAQTSAAEDKEEHADTPPEPSNMENSEAKAATDTKVENCVQEASAVGRTSGSPVTAKVHAAPGVQLKPREESVMQTEPANTRCLEVENKEVSAQTVDGREEKRPPQETNDNSMVMGVKLVVESSAKTEAGAAGEDASIRARVDSDVLVETLSDSPTQPTNETPTESSCVKRPPEQDKEAIVEAFVQAEAPKVPADVGATPREEAPPLGGEQPVSEALPGSPAKSAERESASAGLTEPVLWTGTEEVVRSAPEQRVQHKADQMMEPSPKHAVQLASATDLLDYSAFRTIDLTDALDVDSPRDKSVPKPEDSEQEKVKQQRDATNM